MQYSVSVDWLCEHVAMVRVHEGAGRAYGDPYVWCVTMNRYGNTCILHGAIGPIPRGAARPFLDALRAAGIERRIHERIRGGKVREVVKPL